MAILHHQHPLESVQTRSRGEPLLPVRLGPTHRHPLPTVSFLSLGTVGTSLVPSADLPEALVRHPGRTPGAAVQALRLEHTLVAGMPASHCETWSALKALKRRGLCFQKPRQAH